MYTNAPCITIAGYHKRNLAVSSHYIRRMNTLLPATVAHYLYVFLVLPSVLFHNKVLLSSYTRLQGSVKSDNLVRCTLVHASRLSVANSYNLVSRYVLGVI